MTDHRIDLYGVPRRSAGQGGLVWAPCGGCGREVLAVLDMAWSAVCDGCARRHCAAPTPDRSLQPVIVRLPGDATPRVRPQPLVGPPAAPWPNTLTPMSTEPPATLLRLEKTGHSVGWESARMLSRGWVPHATTGKPTKVVDIWALALWRAGEHAAATWEDGSFANAWRWTDGDVLTPLNSIALTKHIKGVS